jgi:2-keto-3-deoxy-L-arabinonate dehydratase
MVEARLPVVGICPVLETPFTVDGEVDYVSFRNLIRHIADAGVTSVMFPGFASEFYKLSDLERQSLTAELLDFAAARTNFDAVISIPDHATRNAVKVAVAAAEAGAAAINVLPPSQLAPSAKSVQDHVIAIAHAVSPTPVILQYAPAQTGTSLDASRIATLSRMAPNIREVKVESTPPGKLISALLAGAPALRSAVGYGGVQLIDALRRGAVGAQPGCSFVEIYLAIWSSWTHGEFEKAVELHTKLLPYISYWMQSVELIISAEKRISYRRGLIASEHCRAPYQELDEEENAMIERFLREFGLLDTPAAVDHS